MKTVVVAGGGLAGAAAAAELIRAGVHAHVLERTEGAHDKICGEFLSVEAQAHLRALGLDLDALGGAPIGRLRVAAGRRRIEADLPFTAFGLTRRRLDEALLHHVQALGAQVDRGVSVRAIERGHLATSAGTLASDAIVLATGKHEVRGAQRSRAAASDYIGLKMYFRPEPEALQALDGVIEVVLFDGGYAGLQRVEGGVANLCLVVDGARFAALGKRWSGLFAALMDEPLLRERLEGAQPLLDQPLAIAGVPYGFLHRPEDDDPAGDRLYRVGDQAAVIPSFTGDGMAIALHSGRLAGRMIAGGAAPLDYACRLGAAVRPPVRLATTLQRVGESDFGRRALLATLSAFPGLIAPLARRTRIEGPL